MSMFCRTVRRSTAALGASALAVGVLLAGPAAAGADPSEVVVTPSNTQGWYPADVRASGNYDYLADASAPGSPNLGALQLTTAAGDNAAKVQYLHYTDTALKDITSLSYYTKQNAGTPPAGDPSYQLVTCLGGISDGHCVGYTTLVYEPYWNGAVLPGEWQQWDVSGGSFWSSSSYTSGTCVVAAAPGGPPTYTLAALKTACPSAVVGGFGVDIGTYNPGYDVETDLVDFNGTTYNFEPYQVATAKDDCKDGGWQGLTDANGNSFKNQGDCVSYVVSNRNH